MQQSITRFTTEAYAAQGAERPAGRPKYFSTRLGPTVSRPRRQGAATAQPCYVLKT